MTKTCGTCDMAFSNHNYPSLFYCHECCEYVRFGDGVCEAYKERTDSVEKVALDLLAAIKAMHNPCNEDRCCSLADYGWPEGVCAYDFERRLEELGVDV